MIVPISKSKEEMSLEILISTMNRSDLGFLDTMFKHVDIDDFLILVINQIDSNSLLLVSSKENIRVINSFEKGLTNSRNLAIENAKGTLCLIADDDVTYLKGLKETIINAYDKHEEADMVTFKMINDKGKLFREYTNQSIHDKKSIELVNSVVITFKRENLLVSSARFDPLFGLGCIFPTGNEFVFLNNCLEEKLKLYFQPEVILSHPEFSSGQAVGSDKVLFARAALFYKYHNAVGYLKLIHQLLLLLKYKHITFVQILPKFLIGLKGIRKYKALKIKS